MNIQTIVKDYIDTIPVDEPIFVEDVKKYVADKIQKEDQENVLKNVNVILNRLKNAGTIKSIYKGLYYKPIKSIFGDVPLSSDKLRNLKYLKDKDGNIKGYITGAKLYNILGLTTLVPNVTDIVTNECKYHKQYDEMLRTNLIKPKIQITNENYRYLQFIDLLENKDDIHIGNEDINDIFYDYIKKFALDFEKIIKYIRETNSKNALNKLLILAR